MGRGSGVPTARLSNLSGLWEQVAEEGFEAYLVARGYNLFRRKLALLQQNKASHFYKHRGGELEFSQMLNGRVTTSYLRLGERTELEQPDGSPAYVLSSRDGDAWVAVDDEATFEIRRWMDGDMLRITETALEAGVAVAQCKRAFQWVAADPIWNEQTGDMQTFLSRPLSAEEEAEESEAEAEAAPPLGPPVVAEAVRAAGSAADSAASLLSQLGGALAGGWGALESMLADKPPGGEKDWWAFFGVSRSQRLLGSFACGLAGTGEATQGRLYVFDGTLAFYSSLLGSRATLIRAQEMTDVAKASVGLAPAIQVRTLAAGTVTFTNFLSRDAAFELAHKVMWDHGEGPASRPQPLALGFSPERYLFVRVASTRGVAAPGGLSLRLAAGCFEARSPAVAALGAAATTHDFTAVFPCSTLDPGRDELSIRLEGPSGEALGSAQLPLSAAPSAPAAPWLRGNWSAPLAWAAVGAGEAAVAVWTGGCGEPDFRTASAARPRAAAALTRSQRAGDTARCALYEEPRRALLFVKVHSAQGLRPRAGNGKANGLADPLVLLRCGAQEARSSACSDTLAPAWDDSFAFVVAKPLSEAVLLTLYDGEEGDARLIGRVVLPLRDCLLRPRGSRALPAPRWHRISRSRELEAAAAAAAAGDGGPLAALAQAGAAGAAAAGAGEPAGRGDSHGELLLSAFLDSDYLPGEADPPPVGTLSVEVQRASALAGGSGGDVFAVLRYGRLWARLPTVPAAAAEWRQTLHLPVRDMGDVLSVALFREPSASARLFGGGGAPETFLGRAAVRPGSLLPGRPYRRAVQLLLAHADGALPSGTLELGCTFRRHSAAATLGRYLRLPLPPKCYLDPPPASTAAALGEWEEELVGAALAGEAPPLSAAVQSALRPAFDPRLSVRLLRAHVGRLLARLVRDGSGGRGLLDCGAAWREAPGRMVAAHLLFVALVFQPRYIAPAALLAVAQLGFAASRQQPQLGPDPWLNAGGEFERAVAALRGAAAEPAAAAPAAAAEGEDGWEAAPLALADGGEGLDSLLAAALAEPETGAALTPAQQRRLVSQLALYGRAAQAVADAAATRLEQAAAVFAWTEPLVSRAFFTALLLLALGLAMVPPRSLVLAAGLWSMRHPALRAHPNTPSVLPFLLGRLSTKRDALVL